MEKTFRATYYLSNNQFYPATIFITPVTITIRYRDETGGQKDVHWLGDDIVSFERNELESVLLYRNKLAQTEKLLIRDQELIQAILKNFSHKKFVGGHGHIVRSVRSKMLLVLGIIVGVLALGYFILVPWIAERIAMNFSKEKEIALGQQMYESVMSGYKTDEKKTRLLNEFYKELHYKTNYPITITVVASDQVNAFAIPGGHIVVYDAILDGMKSPAELAALLGHEASHVELRHSLRSISRTLARKLFIIMIFGTDAGLAGYLADNADDLKGLEYSRTLETQADDNGLRLMADNGLDTEGMLRLMQLLQKESKGEAAVGFLSTHPVFDERIENIKKQISVLPHRNGGNERLKEIFHELY
jgi:Zn-dependent protease with chaperone function